MAASMASNLPQPQRPQTTEAPPPATGKACPKCGIANAAAAKFCSECGAPLQQSCPQCGKPVDSTAKFCPECGKALK